MTKLILLIAIVWGAYWYWSGPYQASKLSPLEARLEENAKIMKRCKGKEKSMAGVAGMGGLGGVADEGEAFCAKENNLVKKDGQWHLQKDSGR